MSPEGNTGLPQMSPMFVSQNISGIPGNASAEKLALDPNVKLKMEKLEMVRFTCGGNLIYTSTCVSY